jgi:hypothetical protein
MTQPVKVISGFHDCTPPTPSAAIAAGLTNRTAISIESYCAGNVDSFFDSKLFKILLDAISSSIAYDSSQVWEDIPGGFFQRLFRRKLIQLVGSIEMLEDLLCREAADPPSKIVWMKADKPVVIGVAEHWDRLGGPDPYHDSYTFSLYSGITDHARIIEVIRSTATSAGAACEYIEARALR